jgi:hypothetical protein
MLYNHVTLQKASASGSSTAPVARAKSRTLMMRPGRPPSEPHPKTNPHPPGPAAADPLVSQIGDALVTLSSAITTYREIRNATFGRRSSAHMEPAPISSEPFSARVIKIVTAGGPTYEWTTNTTADNQNVTVAAGSTTNVRFSTQYTRHVKSFTPYSMRGIVELRNMQRQPVEVDVSRVCCGGGMGAQQRVCASI